MLRPLCPYDYARCKFMFQEVFDISEDEKFIDAWKSKSDSSSCIVEGGVIVAFAIVCVRYLEYIITDEVMQRQGYGSMLLNHIVQKVPDLYLTTAYDKDTSLVDWYMSRGFYVSSVPDKDAYVMVHKFRESIIQV